MSRGERLDNNNVYLRMSAVAALSWDSLYLFSDGRLSVLATLLTMNVYCVCN